MTRGGWRQGDSVATPGLTLTGFINQHVLEPEGHVGIRLVLLAEVLGREGIANVAEDYEIMSAISLAPVKENEPTVVDDATRLSTHLASRGETRKLIADVDI